MLTRFDFDNCFIYHHWNNADEFAKTELYNLFVALGLEKNDVIKILSGAKKYAIASAKEGQYVGFAEVKELLDSVENKQDLKIFEHFYKIDKKLKQYYLTYNELYGEADMSKLDIVYKDCFKKAKSLSRSTNKKINEISEDFVNDFWMLASIYYALSEHLNFSTKGLDAKLIKSNPFFQNYPRIADGVMIEIINKLQNIAFRKMRAMNDGEDAVSVAIEKLLTALTAPSIIGERGFKHGEHLSNEELLKLITHTKSLILNSSENKVYSAVSVLREYINKVKQTFANSEKLAKVKIKDIMLGSGSVLIVHPKTLHNTSKMLLGESLNKIISSNVNAELSPKKYILLHMFPNLKINGIMDEEKQNAILNNNRSIFAALNTSSLYRASELLANCFFEGLNLKSNSTEDFCDKVFALAEVGVDFEEMFTADNIFEIFQSKFISSKQDKDNNVQNKVTKNIETLSKILNIQDLQEVVHHNFKFFMQDGDVVKNELCEILKQYSIDNDKDNLKLRVETWLNTSVNLETATTGTETEANKLGRKRIKRTRQEFNIDEVLINEELLKELGIKAKNGGIIKSEIRLKKSGPNVDILKIKKALETIKNNGDVDDEEVEDEDEEFLTFEDGLSSLIDEKNQILAYSDALESTSKQVLEFNKDYYKANDNKTSIVSKIISADQGNLILNSSKNIALTKKIGKLFNDDILINLTNKDEINLVIQNLKVAIEALNLIVDNYDLDMQLGYIEETQKSLTKIKSNKNSEPVEEIKKLIKELEERISKSKAKNKSERLAHEIAYKEELELEVLEAQENAKEIRKQRNKINNLTEDYAKLSHEIYAFKHLIKEFNEQLIIFENKLKNIMADEHLETSKKLEELNVRKSSLEQQLKELENEINSIKTSIEKSEDFYDSRYTSKSSINSAYAKRVANKLDGKKAKLEELETKQKKLLSSLSDVEAEIYNLENPINL